MSEDETPTAATTVRRSTRDRPAKSPLSEDAVVDAALAILAADGLEAVTMRRVAAALDTGPASLYVYVAGRDGLVRAMQDRVVASVRLEPPDPARWRAQVHALLGRSRQSLLAHPGIAATTVAAPPRSEAALLYTENLVSLLLAGGLDPVRASWASDLFATLVTYAAIEAEARRTSHADQATEIRATFGALPPDRFPNLVRHADDLVVGDAAERLAAAVDVVLDGMLARSTSS